MALAGYYDERLVALSILIAMVGAYCTIELAERVCAARGRARVYWLLGGAAAMAIGTWAMHYTSMFAFRLPLPVQYDWPTALLSWLPSFLASGLGLLVVSRREMRFMRTLAAGVFMGGGISGMHYSAMESMRLEAVDHYSPLPVILSVALAILISLMSLRIMFEFREDGPGRKLRKAASALLLGAAIPVMHYTAMAAISFSVPSPSPNLSHALSISALDAAGIGMVSVMVLVVALLTSLADRLQQQKEILQKIFDHIPLMISFYDDQGHLKLINREWERTRGWSLKEVQEQNIDVMAESYPDPVERQKARDLISAATGEWADFKTRMKDGRTLDTSWAVVRSSDGTFIGIGQDISERKRSEEALQQAQSRIESVLNSVADLHSLFDRDCRFLYVNEAAVRAFGRLREQILGRTLWEVFPDIVGTELERQYRRAMDERVHVAFEFHYPATDTWWENRFYPAPEGLAVFATDITERKFAEEALRNAERKYRDIFENAIEGIFQTKPGGGYISANPALARMLGFDSPEELIRERSDPARQRYVEWDRHEELFRLLAEEGEVRDFEYEDYRKDGGTIWLSDNVRAVRDSEGTLLYYEGTTQDVTARKLAEQALRESEERYRELFENAKDGIYVHDLNGKYISVNRAAEKLTGYSRAEILGKSFTNFVPPEEVEKIREQLCRKLIDQGATTYEVEVTTKDQRRVAVEVSSHMIYENGVAVAVQGTFRDVTERKRAEEKLKATSEQLRALSARLQSAREEEGTRIAREIHDELGSALTSLKWDLEEIDKLLSTPFGPASIAATREKLHTPIQQADLAILAVRRIASELRPSVLDDLGLVAAIEWQAQQFQARTGIVCVCDCSLEIVELTEEQSTAVFRIFQEALTNILRHAQATRVDIKIKKDDNYFVLSISDNGKGITEQEKSEQQSLGILGMRERAHLIGGELDIQGVAGKGTVVTVRVPVSGQDRVLKMTR